jgi:hypothetical protein
MGMALSNDRVIEAQDPCQWNWEVQSHRADANIFSTTKSTKSVYGHSNSEVFPRHRFWQSVWQVLSAMRRNQKTSVAISNIVSAVLLERYREEIVTHDDMVNSRLFYLTTEMDCER